MTGLILAGGRSLRMGTDKAQLPWGNGTLLTSAVDKLIPLCREIVIVGPRREMARKVRWTSDRCVGAGPLAGLHAGLEEAAFDGVIVLPCDMPAVPLFLLEEIIRQSHGVDMVIPVHSRGYEPLCSWYKRETCLPVVTQMLAEGYNRLQDIMPRIRVCRLEIEKLFPGAPVESFFSNLNTVTDYERAIMKLATDVAGKVG